MSISIAQRLTVLLLSAAIPTLAAGDPCEHGHGHEEHGVVDKEDGTEQDTLRRWVQYRIDTHGGVRAMCEGSGGEYADLRDRDAVADTPWGRFSFPEIPTGGAEVCRWTFEAERGWAFVNPSGGHFNLNQAINNGSCYTETEDNLLTILCAVKAKVVGGEGSWAQMCGNIGVKGPVRVRTSSVNWSFNANSASQE